MTRLCLLLAFIAGCGSTSGTDVKSLMAVTGVYTLTVAPASGSCSPPTLSGPLTSTVTITDDGNGALDVEMPTNSSGDILTSYHVVDQKLDQTTTACGASHEISLVITLETAAHVELTRTDTWKNTAGASSGCSVPAGDCSATVNLSYYLATACPAPDCTLVFGSKLSCMCVNDDGGTSDGGVVDLSVP